MPGAIVTNALATYGDNRAREELDTEIYLIHPEKYPCFTRFAKEKIGNPNFEWVEETIRDPKVTAVVQGASFQATAAATRTRYYNTVQLFADDIAISKSDQALSKVGDRDAVDAELQNKYAALKGDIEFAFLSNQGRTKPASGVASKTTALVGWLQEGVQPSGATITALVNGSQDDATPVTLGTSAGLKTDQLDAAEVGIYEDGGSPDMVLMHPMTKSNLVKFLLSSTSPYADQRQMIGGERRSKTMVMGNVTSIKLPLGHMVELIPDPQWPKTNLDKTFVFILDTSTWKISALRPWEKERQANDGETLRAHVATELGLKCETPKANRVVVNVDHDATVAKS